MPRFVLFWGAASRSWDLRHVADSSLVKTRCFVSRRICVYAFSTCPDFGYSVLVIIIIIIIYPSFSLQFLIFLVVYTKAQRFGIASAEFCLLRISSNLFSFWLLCFLDSLSIWLFLDWPCLCSQCMSALACCLCYLLPLHALVMMALYSQRDSWVACLLCLFRMSSFLLYFIFLLSVFWLKAVVAGLA